jgi:hypothetical protein
MRAKNQRKQTESLLKRIRKRCEWVGRCEICERLSERGEKRTTAPSVPDTVPHLPTGQAPSPLLRRTASVLAVPVVSAASAALAPADMVHACALDEHRCA